MCCNGGTQYTLVNGNKYYYIRSCPAWVRWPSSRMTHNPGKANLVQSPMEVCDCERV